MAIPGDMTDWLVDSPVLSGLWPQINGPGSITSTRPSSRNCNDPDTIICEYDLAGVVVKTGEPFTLSYILVITVRDGELALVRDYMDTMAMSTVLSALS